MVARHATPVTDAEQAAVELDADLDYTASLLDAREQALGLAWVGYRGLLEDYFDPRRLPVPMQQLERALRALEANESELRRMRQDNARLDDQASGRQCVGKTPDGARICQRTLQFPEQKGKRR